MILTFYISTFTILMATKLGSVLTYRRLSTQTLKSSPTCLFFSRIQFHFICFLNTYFVYLAATPEKKHLQVKYELKNTQPET